MKKVWDLDPVFLSQAKALPRNQWESAVLFANVPSNPTQL